VEIAMHCNLKAGPSDVALVVLAPDFRKILRRTYEKLMKKFDLRKT